MASLDFLQVRAVAAKGDARIVHTDTPVAIRIKHIGTGAITSVTTTAATNIVFISDGYTQTYPFAAGLTYNTVGKLVDAINNGACTEAAGGQLWVAKALDTVRSEATTSQFIAGAITAGDEDGTSYYDVLVDTDAADYFAVRLTYDRGFDKTAVKKNHRVNLQEIKYLMNLGTAAVDGVKIYKVSENGVTETLIYSDLSVDNVLTTEVWASGEAKITSDEGGDIVVKIDDAGNLVDSTGNYLRIVGTIE